MEQRIGRFTSSQIYKLMKAPQRGNQPFLQSGLTYIRQKFLERTINNSLDVDAYSNAMAWGRFMEAYAFENHFGTGYTTTSQQTVVSTKYPEHLAGTPDYVKGDFLVSEVKCFYPEKWAELGLSLQSKDLERIKSNHEEIYWQVVCNAFLLGVSRCQMISFMPSIDEMENVKESAEDPMFLDRHNLGDMWQYRFIWEKEIDRLPHVKHGSRIAPLTTFEFEVPEGEFAYLQERLEMAIEILNNEQ